MGIGRVKKSPVSGSALTPTILAPGLSSKKRGSAGLPMGGGGEKRSLRSNGAAGGARRILETSKSEERRRCDGSGPIATMSSSSELSLLISTTLLGCAIVWAVPCPRGLEAERAERREDPLGVPALRLRGDRRPERWAGEAERLVWPDE